MRNPARVRVVGPLERFASGFLKRLVSVGYTADSSTFQLRLMAHLSCWLLREDLGLEALSSSEVERFLVARGAAGYTTYLSPKALAPLLSYLRKLGVVPLEDAPVLSPVEVVLARYSNYLVGERGLALGTVRGYVDMVRPFVLTRLDGGGEVDFAGLTAADVLGFVLLECRSRPRKSAKLLVVSLRSLLGFLHVEGLVDRSLVHVVPSVAAWRLSSLPRGLEVEQAHALLVSCDRATTCGRRDYAMLSMLVRLGMRRGEVAALQLDDIDWRAGEIRVRGKGNQVERLPLPNDVGEALADYLRHGRPSSLDDRRVFARVKAPHQALTPGGVTQVVISAGRRAGLGDVTPHQLRHTAASELLRAGAPLGEIGQLLRHRSQLTTAIYAKVDRDRLRELALPWPGGAA